MYQQNKGFNMEIVQAPTLQLFSSEKLLLQFSPSKMMRSAEKDGPGRETRCNKTDTHKVRD